MVLIALSPAKVLLAVGRNDIAFGMNRDTLKERYAKAVREMQAAGIEVYHINCIYEAVIGQNSFSKWITSHYTENVIDTYTATSNAHNILSADSVHPNQAGNDLIAETVIKSGKLK